MRNELIFTIVTHPGLQVVLLVDIDLVLEQICISDSIDIPIALECVGIDCLTRRPSMRPLVYLAQLLLLKAVRRCWQGLMTQRTRWDGCQWLQRIRRCPVVDSNIEYCFLVIFEICQFGIWMHLRSLLHTH